MEWLVRFEEGEVILTGTQEYSHIEDFSEDVRETPDGETQDPNEILQEIFTERTAKDIKTSDSYSEFEELRSVIITDNTPDQIKDWFSENYHGDTKIVPLEEQQDLVGTLTAFEVEAQNMTTVADYETEKSSEEDGSGFDLGEYADFESLKFKLAKREFEPRVSPEETLFSKFPEFTDLEKQYLDKQYTDKAQIPSLSSGINNIFTIFSTAGFATALVSYGLVESVIVGVLSFLLIPLIYLYIIRSRIKLPRDKWDELYAQLDDAVENNNSVGNSASIPIYVIGLGSGSPFTLPFTRPSVYIPKESFNEFALDEFKAIFEHEIGHHSSVFIKYLSLIGVIVSVNLLAPLLVVTTDITPGFTLFGILLIAAAVSELTPKIYNRWGERKADSYVTNNRAFVRLLLRLSEDVHHVSSRPQQFIHRLIDVHPPINHRIENVFNDDAPEGATEYTLEYSEIRSTYSVGEIFGTILTSVGSILIGVGLLAFVSEVTIPYTYLASGIVLSGVGSYTAKVSRGNSLLGTSIPYVVIFIGVFFSGVYLGGETISEVLAFGYFGPLIGILILILGAVTGGLAYKIIKPSHPDLSELDSVDKSWEDIFVQESTPFED